MQNNPFLENFRQVAFLAHHTQLLMSSYHYWTGEPLIAETKDTVQGLMNASSAIASHQAGDDPIFNYANHATLPSLCCGKLAQHFCIKWRRTDLSKTIQACALLKTVADF